MILLIAFAFLAGIITVLSPCILPILPIILTSSIGGVNTGKSRPLGVVFGFVLSFTFFTLFLSTIVRLSGISADTLRLVSVFVIAGFGLSLLIPQFQVLVEKLFSKLAGFMPNNQNRTGFGGGLLIGLSVGLLWTPCVGPILASVISLAIIGTVTFDAFLITLAYALGTAIPMFLIMIGGQNALRRVPWLLSNLENIQKLFGLIMILTAIGIFFNIDRKFQTFILNTFPQYGVGLTKFEDNDLIKNQLQIKSNTGPKAPELIPGGVWFNSNPLTLEQLKGKVILIDFWTYSCINCQRTYAYLRDWNEKYKDKGLVVIGVHSPEFEFEKNEKNVATAILDFKLTYPIVQDNNFATWRAYNNNYWPAKYFIDKEGNIRHTHFGEGEYDKSEKVIQELLKETGQNLDIPLSQIQDQTPTESLTPETYLGLSRRAGFGSIWTLSGKWESSDEYIASGANSTLDFNFKAGKVFLVLTPATSSDTLEVSLDGKLINTYAIDQARLYQLVDLPEVGSHKLHLNFKTSGTKAFAFTFGE